MQVREERLKREMYDMYSLLLEYVSGPCSKCQIRKREVRELIARVRGEEVEDPIYHERNTE